MSIKPVNPAKAFECFFFGSDNVFQLAISLDTLNSVSTTFEKCFCPKHIGHVFLCIPIDCFHLDNVPYLVKI